MRLRDSQAPVNFSMRLESLEALRQNPSLGHSFWLECWHQCLEAHYDQLALSTRIRTYTFASLTSEADAIAKQLSYELGCVSNRIIAIDSDRDDFLIPFLGAWLAGGIVLPVSLTSDNPTLANSCCSKVASAFIDSNNNISAMCAESIVGANHEERLGWHSLFLTSGTTGKPKLIVRGWRQALFEATAYIKTAKLSSGKILGASIQPTFGALTKHLLGGLMSGCHHQFFSVGKQTAKPEGHFDVLMLTPSLLNALPSSQPLSAGLISLTGEPLNQLSWQHIKRIGKKSGYCLNAYGGTEFGVLANEIVQTHVQLPEFAGEILSGKSIQLVDTEIASESPIMSEHLTEGLIRIHSPWLAEGEITTDSSRKATFHPFPRDSDGFALFQATDIGAFNTAGRLSIIGRLSDRIKRHGRWLNTQALKQVLDHTPGIDAWVCEYDANGQPHLWLQIAIDHQTTQVMNALLEALWHSPLLPGTLSIVSSLPTTSRGKVSRNLLKSSKCIDRIELSPWLESIASWINGKTNEFPWIDGTRTLASLDLDSLDRIDLHLCLSQLRGHNLENFLIPHLSLDEIRQAYRSNTMPGGYLNNLPTLYWLGPIPQTLLQVSTGEFLIMSFDVNQYLSLSVRSPLNRFDSLANRIAQDIYQAMTRRTNRSGHKSYFIGGYSFGANLAHETAIEIQTLAKSVSEIHALLVDPITPAQTEGFKGIARLKHAYYKLWLGFNRLQKVIPQHIRYRTLRRELLLTHRPRVSTCQSTIWTSGRFRATSLPLYQQAYCKPLQHFAAGTDEHLALADNPKIAQTWAMQVKEIILSSGRIQPVNNHVTAHALTN